MKIPQKISEKLYFAIQDIRREPVRDELIAVKKDLSCDQEQLQDRIFERGKRTLLYALENIEFYKNLQEIKEDVLSVRDYDDFCNILDKFPIIDKQKFIKQKKEFQSSQFEKIHGYKTYSSGSTGEPVAFQRDMADWARAHANLIMILQIHGIRYGDPHIYFWGGDWTSSARLSNMVKDFIFNRIKIGGHNKTKDELALQIEKIRSYKPYYIYAVPSCLERICQYVSSIKGHLRDIGIRKIFTTGENLRKKSKTLIESVFGVQVCDIYGSSEVGLIAFDCRAGKKHALIDTNFIEVGDGGNIIITNLFQRKNVIIRYNIGDLCTYGIKWEKCDCGLAYPIIGDISGRDTKDFYLPNGKKINSLSVAYLFDSVIFDGSVIEGRFVLDRKGDLLLYIHPGATFSDGTVNVLKSEAGKLFGMEPIIHLVETIPATRGGKKVDFVSEWSPE